MKLKLPMLAAGFLLLVACNNTVSNTEEKDDTAKAEQPSQDHSHTAPTGEIPALPAVPDGARVYFDNLKDGDNVKSPFQVKMGIEKIRIDTAGPVVAGSGHHHLIVDGGSLVAGEIIPKDSTHIHYGKGQTEAEVVLPPGKHTLTLQFADGLHRSYGEKMSATISVSVKQ